MKTLLLAATAALALCGSVYADTIKVGVVGPFSGPFAIQGKNFKAGIDAYMALNGNKVGGDDIEIIYRDVPPADPAQAKALAQELVVKEGVQYLGGFYFTPDAMAVTPLLEQANVPLVIMNAATSAIITKPARCPHLVHPVADFGADGEGRLRTRRQEGYHGRQRLWPGVDAETAFKKTFEAAGGRSSNSIRMPLDDQ